MAPSVALMPAGDICSPETAAHRRQSQFLDRWAARQACEMITTFERRSHEAELAALSNVRASSLIRMWREMEAEPSPRCGCPSPPAEETSGGSDAGRRGVGKMVRMMSFKISSRASSSSDESELLAVTKEQLENVPAILPTTCGGGRVVRVRGRKEMEGLVMRMKEERLREIADLAEKQKVSRFPFRGRIQQSIRLRSWRQGDATIKHQQRSIKLDVKELRGSNNICFREIAEDVSQNEVNEIGTEEHTTDSQVSDLSNSVDHSETEDAQYTDLVSTTELESSPQAFQSGEVLMEETKAFPGFNRSAEQTFVNNAEIRELLKRKTVTNSLASDFCHKLDHLIMSFMQKQALQYVNEVGRDGGCEEETIWRQNYEDFSEQDTSASSDQNSSASKQDDEDVMNDLRDGFAVVQSELSELRKLVESCLEWQKRMECSIKQEFSSAVNHLVGRRKSSPNTKWNGTCCIYCEAQVDTVLYRCGHMCACFKCSQGLQWSCGNCPICRSTIIDVVRVYPNI